MTTITKTEVKKYGFTESSIERFLGEPDLTKPNPFYRTAAKMQLFDESRVIAVSESREFREWLDWKKPIRTRASEQMRKVVNAKKQKLFDYINQIEITFEPMTRDQLLIWAKRSYRAFQETKDNYDVSFKDWPEEHLNRIMENTLRHEFTSYDYELHRMFGQIGKNEGYELLNERISEEIGKAFPFLRQ